MPLLSLAQQQLLSDQHARARVGVLRKRSAAAVWPVRDAHGDPSPKCALRCFDLPLSLQGTGKFGWPASILNLFWEVLKWKKEAEDELVASGIPFTIIRRARLRFRRDMQSLPRDSLVLSHVSGAGL